MSVDGESSTLRFRTQNTNYNNRYSDWNDFIFDHSRQEVQSLTVALEALTDSPASEDELGEAWHLFKDERMSPGAVWQIWLDSFQMNVLTISFQELGIPTMDDLTGGKNRPALACSYRGVIAGMQLVHFPAEYMLLLLLDNELRPTVKASRSEISDMPLELIAAIRGILSAWGPNWQEPFRIQDWRLPPLPAWRKLHGTKLEVWLWNHLQDRFKYMKESFGQPIFAGDKGVICIGSSWLETENVIQAFLMASLQDACQMKVNYEEGQVITFADKSPDEDAGSYDLFPPMMFCTAATQASRRFLCSGAVYLRQCINADHPYTVWLLKNVAALNGYFNRQFKQIINAFFSLDSTNIINMCNNIRDQLLSLPERHSIDMTACPQLSDTDFWVPTEEPKDI